MGNLASTDKQKWNWEYKNGQYQPKYRAAPPAPRPLFRATAANADTKSSSRRSSPARSSSPTRKPRAAAKRR